MAELPHLLATAPHCTSECGKAISQARQIVNKTFKSFSLDKYTFIMRKAKCVMLLFIHDSKSENYQSRENFLLIAHVWVFCCWACDDTHMGNKGNSQIIIYPITFLVAFISVKSQNM